MTGHPLYIPPYLCFGYKVLTKLEVLCTYVSTSPINTLLVLYKMSPHFSTIIDFNWILFTFHFLRSFFAVRNILSSCNI